MITLRSLDRRVRQLERTRPQRVVVIKAPEGEEAFQAALAAHETAHGRVDRDRDVIVHLIEFFPQTSSEAPFQ
jgi:hypothetical protein